MAGDGKLQKLIIYPFLDPGFSQSAGEAYTVMINPEKYSHNHSISYNSEQAPGTSGVSTKFEKVSPEKISFELVFDGTGIIPNATKNIHKEIENFKKIVYTYNGEIHSPNYLKISWGTMLFTGRLTSMDLNYTLFRPNGTPLRVKANVSFEEYVDAKTLSLWEKNKSPDLTRKITIKAGDNLALLCNTIYGDSNQHLMVAAYNGLNSFRDIHPGDTIYFPPLPK